MCFNHLYMNQTHLDQSGGNIGGPLEGINDLIELLCSLGIVAPLFLLIMFYIKKTFFRSHLLKSQSLVAGWAGKKK